MSQLVTVAVFGVVGAVMMAALVGLVSVFAGRGVGTVPRIGFGALLIAVLVTMPTLAALNTLGSVSGTGFGAAFLSAFGVLVIVSAANMALLPMVARRAAEAAGVSRARVSLTTVTGGIVVSAVLGLVTAGLAVAVS